MKLGWRVTFLGRNLGAALRQPECGEEKCFVIFFVWWR